MQGNIVYWQWDPNVFNMRRMLETQSALLTPRATSEQRKDTKKREKNILFNNRMTKTLTIKLCCSFPGAVARLLGPSWTGQDQRDSKSTANNILNGLLWHFSCGLRAVWRHLMCVCVCVPRPKCIRCIQDVVRAVSGETLSWVLETPKKSFYGSIKMHESH